MHTCLQSASFDVTEYFQSVIGPFNIIHNLKKYYKPLQNTQSVLFNYVLSNMVILLLCRSNMGLLWSCNNPCVVTMVTVSLSYRWLGALRLLLPEW